MNSFEHAKTLQRSGHLRDALAAVSEIPASRRRDPDIALLEAELLAELGNPQRACDIAARFENSAQQKDRAVALRVLSQATYHLGDVERAARYLSDARQVSREIRNVEPDLYASVLLLNWRLFSRFPAFAAPDAQFAELRRTVAHAGQIHQIAELRLCAAEVEARKSSPHEALRHTQQALELLHSSPNLWLEGIAYNHASNIYGILGDIENARDFALRGARTTDISGHFRVRIAAEINLAHLELSSGASDKAERILRGVLAHVGPHVHLRAAALDGLAHVCIRTGRLQEARDYVREVLSLKRSGVRNLKSHWEHLSERYTLANLRAAEKKPARAISILENGIRDAIRSGDRLWARKMQLRVAELAAQTGDDATFVQHLTPSLDETPESVETIAQVELARAIGDSKRDASTSKHGARGQRILSAVGIALPDPVNAARIPSSSAGETSDTNADDAIALIELAGYPHVLAREAYALLESANAVEHIALVARGNGRPRVIATRGWDEAAAVTAATDAADRLRIPCGQHRDETWELVADVRPALADRCTAIAVRKLVDTAVTLDRYRREEKQRAALWPADSFETDGGLWISEQMTELLSIARRVAPADITVLLTGETGTGKEVLARAIHRASTRAAKPFVPFNCTAVAREMLESQLFGYRKGAFTGADAPFDGVIRGAAGGTIFLDEIAEIGQDLQPKLLRFLETHEIHGLGEPQPVKVDVRVIAATNADLEELVRAGRFREDLFYRLNVVRLKLPPLRERREEIPPLIDHYLRAFCDELKKGRLTLDDETLEFLLLYSWPGNVRQLVNELRRVVAYAEPDSRVTPALLSPEIQASRRTVRVLPGDEPEIRIRLDQPLGEAIEIIEQAMVKRALQRAQGNYENASRLLGISRKGLFLKRRRWGMQRAS